MSVIVENRLTERKEPDCRSATTVFEVSGFGTYTSQITLFETVYECRCTVIPFHGTNVCSEGFG